MTTAPRRALLPPCCRAGVVFSQYHSLWASRLSLLARVLWTCTGGAVLLAGVVAAVMMALVIRAGLLAWRQMIGIVHGLGATDGNISGCATRLAAAGNGRGMPAALLVLLALIQLTAPLGGKPLASDDSPNYALRNVLAGIPLALGYVLPCLPLGPATIGLVVAQAATWHWLRRLP